MIIKNQSLIDKVIEQLMHDQEDQKPLQLYLQKIEQLNQHIQLLIPNIKLVQFFNIGQQIECDKHVYLLLKGKVNSEDTILKHTFIILRPSLMLTFNRTLMYKIEQLNQQRQIEHKLTFLIQYTFFSGIYMSQLRQVIEQIPLVSYQYNTNLSRILPGTVCIIQAGSIVLQSKNGPFPKQFSIINEKDFFGEVHFVDDENKINLKHLSIHQNYYEAICNSQTVELYLLNINQLNHTVNMHQLKISLAKKFKERMSQLRYSLELSKKFSPEKQVSQQRLRIKTLNSDNLYEHMKQKEQVAIEKVKEVVKNMNFSYSRTRNYFAKLGANNMMFHKAFMYKYSPNLPVKKRQSSMSSAIQLTQRNTRTRCQTVSQFDFSSRVQSENKGEKQH